MRRLLGLLVPVLLLVSLLAAPTVAFADTPDTAIVLAAEAGEPTGPDPAPREQEDNPARTLAGYEDRELQFTWGAAWILLVAGVAGLTVLGGLYYLLVHRPQREAAAGRR
ncbi:hypothetical protein [Egicoccus sp. AB-alg2]|uniref:hypothetical protein n=1 Tax=Egicoccus sp. AB-alg2 TaxID=3242693 RepID=UPI00359E11F7